MKLVIIFTLALFLALLQGCGSGPEYQIPGAKGVAGNDGANGKDGAAGPTGAQGDKGDKGDKGDQGVPGTPGTAINTVQLCSSCVGAYPNVFPEVGICLGGVLYGVYSANGGFMVALSNGYYSSNGINCSCSFHINGCEVTP